MNQTSKQSLKPISSYVKPSFETTKDVRQDVIEITNHFLFFIGSKFKFLFPTYDVRNKYSYTSKQSLENVREIYKWPCFCQGSSSQPWLSHFVTFSPQTNRWHTAPTYYEKKTIITSRILCSLLILGRFVPMVAGKSRALKRGLETLPVLMPTTWDGPREVCTYAIRIWMFVFFLW